MYSINNDSGGQGLNLGLQKINSKNKGQRNASEAFITLTNDMAENFSTAGPGPANPKASPL
jgi:hypothetical protein